MALKKLVWNGISSLDLGLVIQSPPAYQYPEKDVTSTHIPGRNGDVITDNGSYKNITRTYSLGVGFKPGTDFISNSQDIVKWLTSDRGYRRLEDDYDPTAYRLAKYSSGGSFTNICDGAISFSVDFDCKPQRFLKSGENILSFTSNEFSLENPSQFSSLPEITLEGLKPDISSEILLSLENNGETISDVTFKDIDTPSITIDSENQEVYYQTQDLASKININGKVFPKFPKGSTKVTISKYKRNLRSIASYNDIISDTQSEMDIVYSPYDRVLEQKQKKVVIPTFNSKKIAYQDVFYAEAYSLLAQEKGKNYSFKSFDDILKEQCYSSTFLTNTSENVSDSGFVELVSEGKTDKSGKALYSYKVHKSLTSGGYFYATGFKKWKYVASGGVILADSTQDSQVTIKYCPAKTVNGKTEMDVEYSDMPDWLKISIDYDSDGSPKKVHYQTGKAGYFYAEKTGVLSKFSKNRSGWEYYDADAHDLGSVTWSLFKQSFQSSMLSSLGNSKTSLDYKYVDVLPQYEDVYGTKTDKNGNKTKIVTTACPITVTGSLTSPVYTAKKAGWFRANYSGCEKEDDPKQFSSWKHLNVGDTVPDYFSDITQSNTFYFIDDDTKVNYSKSSGWPEWLESTVVANDNKNILNSGDLSIKVLKKAKYRKLESTSEDGDVWTEWKDLEIGASIDLGSPENENTVCMIETLPTSYEQSHNLSFNQEQLDKLTELAPYLRFEWVEGIDAEKDEDRVDSKYRLYAAKDGYYKWDTNAEWKKLSNGDLINESKYSDDTTIYYLESLPLYPDNDLYTSKIEESEYGNPVHALLYIKKDGYYRLDDKTSWVWYKKGDFLVSSDPTTSHLLNYLVQDKSGIKGITIKIKPNWWTL